jgi:BirA family biotin operon repressor/biotin-[acetyl-CoA-carboxylase] ligase
MSSDDLSPAIITDNLGTSFAGQRVIYYPRLSSTMDIARQEARRGALQGTVIIAGEQTGGRGRVNRHWLSPRGNIAISVILYPAISFLPYLIMLASLAVVHSIESVTGLRPQLKWPNDILISGKKVGGILIASEVKGSRVEYSIIGIGINIGLRPSDFSEIAATATSLNDEMGRDVSPTDIIRGLLVEIERLYLTLPDGESIYKEWRDRLVTLGRRVCVESGNSTFEGIAESVDRSGALMLRHADGSSIRIVAGDITLHE